MYIFKSLLYQVYSAEGMQTLFRGNSLASKTMTYCFKAFGGNYLNTLLGPLITPMYKELISFEVDPTRLDCKVYQSINQSVSQSVSQSVRPSVRPSINQSINQSTN